MKRGDVITVALPGAYGKPRPALIVQSDLFLKIPSVTILPLTSDLIEAPLARVVVDPSPENGLQKRSQVMVDKAYTVPRQKIGSVCGHLDDRTMLEINRALALFLGFA
jgi:mRNA interferase MazF